MVWFKSSVRHPSPLPLSRARGAGTTRLTPSERTGCSSGLINVTRSMYFWKICPLFPRVENNKCLQEAKKTFKKKRSLTKQKEKIVNSNEDLREKNENEDGGAHKHAARNGAFCLKIVYGCKHWSTVVEKVFGENTGNKTLKINLHLTSSIQHKPVPPRHHLFFPSLNSWLGRKRCGGKKELLRCLLWKQSELSAWCPVLNCPT